MKKVLKSSFSMLLSVLLVISIIPAFSVTASAETVATTEQMTVIRKIIYAVETGGQVYGNVDYSDFTEAYTNSSIEYAITIGGGQWYATEAKRLLNLIRSTAPTTFASLDTAGIATDLDTKDWSKYAISKTSAKAKCIQKIISSSVGIKCQDRLLDDQMSTYMAEARNLGVTELDAQMMCANFRHQGGLGAVKRIIAKTATPYTLDNLYAACQTDTGNQVGAYKSRQKLVYNSLKKYLPEASKLIPDSLKYLVFDAEYYSATYPDLKEKYGTDEAKLYQHFLDYGIAEGRQAHPCFSVSYYVNEYSNTIGTTDYTEAIKYYINGDYTVAVRTAKPVDLGDVFVAKLGFSDKVLSLYGSSVILYHTSTSVAQEWQFIKQDNGSYKILNAKYKKCLEVKGGVSTSGTDVQMNTDDGTNAQRWFIYEKNGKYILKAFCSGGCVLDVADGKTDDLTNIQQYNYSGESKQLFDINILSYTPADLGEDFYANISYSTANLSVDSDNVVVNSASTDSSQIWRFTRKTDGSYKIVNQGNRKCMEVTDGASESGVNVQTNKNNDSDSQSWFIYQYDGKYVLRSACSSTCVLDVADASATDGTNVQQCTYQDCEGQWFTINTVEYDGVNENLGDVNGDGVININDTTELQKYIAKMDINIIADNSDVNYDNVINVSDATKIQMYLAGIISSFE